MSWTAPPASDDDGAKDRFLRPACRCGLKKSMAGSLHGKDDGKCYRHPEKWREGQDGGDR